MTDSTKDGLTDIPTNRRRIEVTYLRLTDETVRQTDF